MAGFSRSSIVFNVAGIAVLVGTLGYAMKDAVSTPVSEPCSSRYSRSVAFSLSNSDGQPLSAIELQARSGQREWGLYDNAMVAAGPDQAFPEVLKIAFNEVESAHQGIKSGVGFTWQPEGLTEARSACLSYQVWLPANFDYGRLGILPGLFGGHSSAILDEREPQSGFVTRLGWSGDGVIGVETKRPGTASYWATIQGQRLDKGQWLKVEQEVTLNQPGRNDGRMQIWINGELRHKELDLNWYGTAPYQLAGVAVEVGRDGEGTKTSPISLSPLTLSWR